MSTFQTLPQEVLDNILEPLYITDQISLRLTCRTLYLRSPPFVDLYTVLHGHGYTTEAMMLSLVLERDMKPEYRVCGRCHRLHRTHFFEPAELGKSDAWSRACTGKKSFAVLDPLACENKDTPFWKIKGIREELEENMGAGARKNDDMQVKRWYEGEEHGIGGKIWPPEQNEREIFYGLNASRERQRMAYTRNYLGPSGAENRVDSKDQGVQLMVWMDRKHFFLAQDGRGGNDLIVATVWYLDLEAICGPCK